MEYAQSTRINGVRHTKLQCLQGSNNAKYIAPLVGDVTIQYRSKEFNGSFMKENIYRQVGSTEVDKAWEDLGANCEYTAIIGTGDKSLTIYR
jgi:hypothetical protein